MCAPLIPTWLSLWQFWKKWTICLDYPWFSSGIELRLVTVAADSILRLTRVLRTECELRLILFCSWLKFRRLDTSCSCLEFRRLDTSYDLFIYLFNNLFKIDKNWLHATADSSSGSWIQVAADSILWLTRFPAAWYELRLTRVPVAGHPSPGCI